MMHRKTTIQVLWLLMILLIAVGCGSNKFEREVEKEKSAVALLRQTAAGGYDIVTTDELQKLVDENADMILIDSMPYEESYRKAHIPGAINFHFSIPIMDEWDVSKTEAKTQADYAKLLGPDKGKLIVVYCGFVKCTRSHNGAAWATKMGYTNVKRYPGGIYAWKGAGNRTEAGE